MLKDIIAKRYAKALLSLSSKSGDADAVKKDLAQVAEVYRTSKGLQSVFMNPVFSLKDKIKVMNGLAKELGGNPLTLRFLDLLARKRRFRYIREVSAAYSDLLDLAQGRVKASVASAAPLSDAEVGMLKAKISGMVGKDVELTMEVDPSLIGGVRTRIGSTVYDGSLSNQVRLVRAALLRG